MIRLEQIVRALAAVDPRFSYDAQVGAVTECRICGAEIGGDSPHEPRCAWMRAKAWVSAHPKEQR